MQETRSINIRVPESLFAEAVKLADAERRSLANWVRNLIEDRIAVANAPEQLTKTASARKPFERKEVTPIQKSGK